MSIEEWSHETGEKTIQSNGGSLTVGDKYASNYIVVHPFDRVQGSMTLKLQVNDEDATVYRTDDYVLWIRSDCSISGSVASCSTNAGEKMVSLICCCCCCCCHDNSNTMIPFRQIHHFSLFFSFYNSYLQATEAHSETSQTSKMEI